jgi:hypothetical protein
MSQHSATSTPESAPAPQTDFVGGLIWVALGGAILIGSLRMDRLESQGVSPFAAPGLMPGLLGIVMMLFGGLLALRGWRQGGSRHRAAAAARGQYKRVALILALCVAFGIGLVGHGLPFWAAASIFVTVAILALQQPERQAEERRLTVRTIAVAALTGIAAGVGVTLVFQGIFLVHLP